MHAHRSTQAFALVMVALCLVGIATAAPIIAPTIAPTDSALIRRAPGAYNFDVVQGQAQSQSVVSSNILPRQSGSRVPVAAASFPRAMPTELSKYFRPAAAGRATTLPVRTHAPRTRTRAPAAATPVTAEPPVIMAVITNVPVPTPLGSVPGSGDVVSPVVTVIRGGSDAAPSPITVVAATPTSSASSSAPTETPSSNGGVAGIDVSSGMIGLVNAARAQFGRQPYDIDAALIKSCVGHAADMAEHRFMDHTGSNGSSPASRATKAGYSWGFIAENVAAGQKTIAAVMDAWMNSQGHRDNILSGTAVDFAAAYARSEVGTLYWVQCFGRPL
ncbi:hypothetical protein AMAG_02207 [Allomyces macrogynus ATCC 38327]|uniref:SCP domain-containing protein n=1 Tax=Allomyces macrogynus (strain ATCC 38327) TaxID=578462 RepID=A0A0L0S1I0_ALLM3|nr:hypothetical protein AMAG_02207 [Allomyces macrogynus ATCC 38327]|eukprot:KNE56398.1 hypothetical protein AMAG_02207 [Allomyces macrogynus ATCC 38327]